MIMNPHLKFFCGSSVPHLICRFFGYVSSPYHSYSIHLILKHPIAQHGISPLQALPHSQNIKYLRQIKSLLVVQGLMEDESLVGELIKVCFHLGIARFALNILDKLDKPSLFLQNLVIRCFSDHGLHGDLLNLYTKCQKSGYGSDNYTFPFVIKACASLRALRTGKETHGVVLRTGFEQNIVVQTALVDMYAKTDHMESARTVLDRIPQPDLVSWNALLSGYSYNGLDHEAFGVFQRIQEVGFKPNVSTFASLIPVCARLGTLDFGRSLHGLAIKFGVSLEENVVPALVSMYGNGENLSFARKLFDMTVKKNVVIWNAMISTYTQNRKTNEAFEVYCQMLQENVLPTFVTFVSIIPSCDNLGDTRYGESVHACAIKQGVEHQPAVITALLSMYAKLGDIESAQFLFDGMPERSLLSWNSMVSAYVQNGLPEEGLTAFREMQLVGWVPDSVSIVGLLSACTRLRYTHMGMSAHAYCLRKAFDLNLNVSNALLTFYSDCDMLSTCIKLLRKMVVKNVVSWNTLISSCVRKGDIRTVVNLIHQMQQDNVKFDLVTMISVLPSYCEPENLVGGMAVHGHAIKTGFISDISLINALISMYVNCGNLNAGHKLFEGMPLRTVVSWNALITGYRNNDFHQDVTALFHQMTMEGQKPNFVTLLNVLPICCNQLQGKSIHAYAIRSGDISEPPLLTSLMFMYARFDKMNLCCLLFERADNNNVTMWNAIMSVYVQTKNFRCAFASFHKMLQMGVEPDYVTMLTLISASVQLSSMTLTQSVMAYIICKGFEKNVLVTNALIDLYCRSGCISIARKIFDRLIEKDAVSWSVMINGHGINGDGEAALALFSQMKGSGFKPDDVTFINALSACSHAGLVEKGKKLFNSMTEEYGIKPRMEHYACMVDLLGRTGHLAEAFDLVKGLPIRPSPSLLESLLGACSSHGNFELAKDISTLLFDLNLENSGSYVMLSNVYAAAGRWTEASRVRSNMDEISLRKIPGFSRIEVNGY